MIRRLLLIAVLFAPLAVTTTSHKASAKMPPPICPNGVCPL